MAWDPQQAGTRYWLRLGSQVSSGAPCRSKRLLERRHKQAQFRDADKRLHNFNFQFNAKMNRNLVFELATNWIGKRGDALLLGQLGSGKVTAHKPSDTLSTRMGTVCFIAKPTHCWKK